MQFVSHFFNSAYSIESTKACKLASMMFSLTPTVPHSRLPSVEVMRTRVLAAVPAINPDVGIIHAQRADRNGNVQIWGLLGVQKEAVLASSRSIVTVEEIVDELPEVAGAIVLPSWVLSSVCLVPNGAHPSFAMGFSVRDNNFYKAWDPISKDRDAFLAWIDKHVIGTADFAEYCESVGIDV